MMILKNKNNKLNTSFKIESFIRINSTDGNLLCRVLR